MQSRATGCSLSALPLRPARARSRARQPPAAVSPRPASGQWQATFRPAGDTGPVSRAHRYAAEGKPLARGMRQLLEEGEAGLSFARACVAGGKWRVALATVKLLAPIYDPEKIVCVG